jgi:hypothetical protein
MRLHDVANRFNQTECRDGYSGAVLFKAQVLPYDEVRRDSLTFDRRVFSVSPVTSVPARRVVRAMGQQWVLGEPSVDQFMGTDIRHGYVAQKAETQATLTTIGKMVNQQQGVPAWAGRAWVKNPAFSEQSSDLSVQYDVYLSSTETLQERDIINYLGEPMVVRAVHPSESGFLRATCEALSLSSFLTGTLTSGTWNPITETFAGTSQTLPVLKIRWQALFEYSSTLSPDFAAGDQQFAFSSTLVAKPLNAELVLPDASKWTIKSAIQLPDSAWLCRATRHG